MPPQLYAALTDPRYTRELDEHFDSLPEEFRNRYKDSHISTTTLVRPPRQVELTRRHWKDIIIDPAGRLPSLYGTSIHEMLRRYPCGFKVEERVGVAMGGWYCHGAIDTYDPVTGDLTDWKMTKAGGLAYGLKPEHVAQLNINAWFKMKTGGLVGDLILVYLLRDFSKKFVSEGSDYPEGEVVVQQVPKWDPSDTHRYVWARLQAHANARHLPDNDLPACTPEERWARPDRYAVQKPGSSRAKKIFDSKGEATEWLAEHVVELEQSHEAKEDARIAGLKNPERGKRKEFADPGYEVVVKPGDPCVRCSFCDARPVCSQYERLMNEYGQQAQEQQPEQKEERTS